jgi:hypothetical protein
MFDGGDLAAEDSLEQRSQGLAPAGPSEDVDVVANGDHVLPPSFDLATPGYVTLADHIKTFTAWWSQT